LDFFGKKVRIECNIKYEILKVYLKAVKNITYNKTTEWYEGNLCL